MYETSLSYLKPSNSLSPIPFTLTISLSYLPKLSLGPSFQSINFSLVHQLFLNNQILSKSFSLYLIHKTSKDNKLFIGGIPSYLIKDKNAIKVFTKEIERGWAIHIKSFTVNNKSIEINKYGLLGIEYGSIIVEKNI